MMRLQLERGALAMDIDPQAVKTGFDLVKGAIDTLKGLRDLIPSKSGQKEDVAKQIEMAERQVALGEAQLAQALGYPLCRKHFPPKPMLAVGVHPKYVEAIYRCPDCGAEQPPREHFDRIDEIESGARNHNERIAKDWMGV